MTITRHYPALPSKLPSKRNKAAAKLEYPTPESLPSVPTIDRPLDPLRPPLIRDANPPPRGHDVDCSDVA
ncbi:hypothetical protein LCGC14_1041550 [marine sediment metagenome]|uniref:Uncharacterized protein n=1 Tax=marine sediment metagenome TaxID=412755 RepID=A0A0F9NDA2_9ZZZZ